jgi:uncharacterized GH25 family protein
MIIESRNQSVEGERQCCVTKIKKVLSMHKGEIKMKKAIFLMTVCLLVLLLSTTAAAHELWIEVEHKTATEQLRVDISWGHLRDFYDPVNIENLSLFVRYPDGQVAELVLEEAGVQGRAFVTPKGEGEYLFWALRKPGTFTPGDGITRLSIHSAKTAYLLGDGPATSSQPTDLPLEIVPAADISTISPGVFSGKVLFEGEPLPGAVVVAYGPDELSVSGETASDGSFKLDLPSAGKWLVKASFQVDEEGRLGEVDYARISRTSTLLFTLAEVAAGTPPAEPAPAVSEPAVAEAGGVNSLAMLTFLVGLLLGAAAAFFFAGRAGSCRKPGN